jgi:hypothetical protein
MSAKAKAFRDSVVLRMEGAGQHEQAARLHLNGYAGNAEMDAITRYKLLPQCDIIPSSCSDGH